MLNEFFNINVDTDMPKLAIGLDDLIHNSKGGKELTASTPYIVNLAKNTYADSYYQPSPISMSPIFFIPNPSERLYPISAFLVTDLPKYNRPAMFTEDGGVLMKQKGSKSVPVQLEDAFSCVIHPICYYIAKNDDPSWWTGLWVGHPFYVPRGTDARGMKAKKDVGQYCTVHNDKLVHALPLAIKGKHFDMQLLWSAVQFGSKVKNFYQFAPSMTQLRLAPILEKSSGQLVIDTADDAEEEGEQKNSTSASFGVSAGRVADEQVGIDADEITCDEIMDKLDADHAAFESTQTFEGSCSGSF